jgi:hypothetical protein
MKDKILQALRSAGHGLTLNALWKTFPRGTSALEMQAACYRLENDKLVFLHRADGSANTVKGEIVLITLRNPEPDDFEIVQIGPNAFLKIQKTKR